MTFWEVFVLLCIFVPVAAVYFVALPDLFRRGDLSGGWKVTWMLVILLVPLIGTIVYLMRKPSEAALTAEMEEAVKTAERHLAAS